MQGWCKGVTPTSHCAKQSPEARRHRGSFAAGAWYPAHGCLLVLQGASLAVLGLDAQTPTMGEAPLTSTLFACVWGGGFWGTLRPVRKNTLSRDFTAKQDEPPNNEIRARTRERDTFDKERNRNQVMVAVTNEPNRAQTKCKTT